MSIKSSIMPDDITLERNAVSFEQIDNPTKQEAARVSTFKTKTDNEAKKHKVRLLQPESKVSIPKRSQDLMSSNDYLKASTLDRDPSLNEDMHLSGAPRQPKIAVLAGRPQTVARATPEAKRPARKPQSIMNY